MGSLSTQFGVAGSKTQSYFYTNGNPVAEIGDERVSIVPINTQYKGGSTPGTYALNVGDSLSSIAQTLFGDGSLWYVIAEANALNRGPADRFGANDAGRTLRIPNLNQALRNDSLAFKPYNSTEIIGDLTPSPEILPPPPPKSKGGGCGGLAKIVMVAIVVVATIYTAGAAAGALGAATSAGAGATFGATMAAGVSTMAGAGGMLGMAAAAVGGFVGSVAGQLAGKAMGVVDHFSLRQAVGSGLTAGATAGAGSILSGAGNGTTFMTTNAQGASVFNTAGKFAMGASSYAAAYVSTKAVGLETHFNWTDMAVATISSGISGKTGNSTLDAAMSTGSFGANFASNLWGATVSSSLSRLAGRGGKQDWGSIAEDAFGNALASEVIKLSMPKIEKPKGGKEFSLDNYDPTAGMSMFGATEELFADASSGMLDAGLTKDQMDYVYGQKLDELRQYGDFNYQTNKDGSIDVHMQSDSLNTFSGKELLGRRVGLTTVTYDSSGKAVGGLIVLHPSAKLEIGPLLNRLESLEEALDSGYMFLRDVDKLVAPRDRANMFTASAEAGLDSKYGTWKGKVTSDGAYSFSGESNKLKAPWLLGLEPKIGLDTKGRITVDAGDVKFKAPMLTSSSDMKVDFKINDWSNVGFEGQNSVVGWNLGGKGLATPFGKANVKLEAGFNIVEFGQRSIDPFAYEVSKVSQKLEARAYIEQKKIEIDIVKKQISNYEAKLNLIRLNYVLPKNP